MCRLYSRRLSALRPQLDAANVGFVAVGLEELGAEEFVKGEFFNGGKSEEFIKGGFFDGDRSIIGSHFSA